MCVTDLDITENEQIPGVAWGQAGKYAGVAWGQLGTEAEEAQETGETSASR